MFSGKILNQKILQNINLEVLGRIAQTYAHRTCAHKTMALLAYTTESPWFTRSTPSILNQLHIFTVRTLFSFRITSVQPNIPMAEMPLWIGEKNLKTEKVYFWHQSRLPEYP